MYRLVSLFVLSVFCLNTNAASFVVAYPHAELISSEKFETNDYRISAGKVDVVNNILRMENEIRLDVRGNKFLYKVHIGYTSGDAFNYYVNKLKDINSNILFRCQGRGCGDSNSWANIVLSNSKLYGKERDQHYLIAKIEDNKQVSHVLIYTIKRGNGKVYLYIEELNQLTVNDATEDPRKVILDQSFNGKGQLIDYVNNRLTSDLNAKDLNEDDIYSLKLIKK